MADETSIHKLTLASKGTHHEPNPATTKLENSARGTSAPNPHTRSSGQEPINEEENAMDIALGCEGEGWDRRRRSQRYKRTA